MFKVLAVLLVVLSSTGARAEQAPSVAEPPVESGLAVQQVLLGTVSSLFAAIGGTALGIGPRSGSGYALTAGLISTAVLPGLAVCTLGGSSRWYDGSCAGPIVGAFLGTLLVGIPMGRAAAADVTNGDTGDISGSFLVTAFVLTAVGAGLGATLGWHAFKHRRHPADGPHPVANLAPLPPAWPELPVRRLAVAPGTFTAPVLAFSF